jgi:hypothetical protein
MALHPKFPTSPYAPLIPEQRWFPADEALRSTAYEKLLPPLVAHVRKEVYAWRNKGYAGASATSVGLLQHWFDSEHLTENADGSLATFLYYFAQREAVETVILGSQPGIHEGVFAEGNHLPVRRWMFEVRCSRIAIPDLLTRPPSLCAKNGQPPLQPRSDICKPPLSAFSI